MFGFSFSFFVSQNPNRGISNGKYDESVGDKECLGEIEGEKSVLWRTQGWRHIWRLNFQTG